MLPELIELPKAPWCVLPAGIHSATLIDIEQTFVFNQRRSELFEGLKSAVVDLSEAGCQLLYLDGSFVTSKPRPGDYDVCWDPTGVQELLLPKVFLDFSERRARQKARYGGEFFPLSFIEKSSGFTFLEYFQQDGQTGLRKGILSIELNNDFPQTTG